MGLLSAHVQVNEKQQESKGTFASFPYHCGELYTPTKGDEVSDTSGAAWERLLFEVQKGEREKHW